MRYHWLRKFDIIIHVRCILRERTGCIWCTKHNKIICQIDWRRQNYEGLKHTSENTNTKSLSKGNCFFNFYLVYVIFVHKSFFIFYMVFNFTLPYIFKFLYLIQRGQISFKDTGRVTITLRYSSLKYMMNNLTLRLQRSRFFPQLLPDTNNAQYLSPPLICHLLRLLLQFQHSHRSSHPYSATQLGTVTKYGVPSRQVTRGAIVGARWNFSPTGQEARGNACSHRLVVLFLFFLFLPSSLFLCRVWRTSWRCVYVNTLNN